MGIFGNRDLKRGLQDLRPKSQIQNSKKMQRIQIKQTKLSFQKRYNLFFLNLGFGILNLGFGIYFKKHE
jgi:hypothetical protein